MGGCIMHARTRPMQAKTVVFIGPQGSGKGTQAKLLVDHLESLGQKDICSLETGMLLRKMEDYSDRVSKSVAELLERGKMIPDPLVASIIIKELETYLTPSSHLVIDGFSSQPVSSIYV